MYNEANSYVRITHRLQDNHIVDHPLEICGTIYSPLRRRVSCILLLLLYKINDAVTIFCATFQGLSLRLMNLMYMHKACKEFRTTVEVAIIA